MLAGVSCAVSALALVVWNGTSSDIDSVALAERVLGSPELRGELVDEAAAGAVASSSLGVPDLVVRQATRFALSRPEADPLLSTLLVAQLAANRAEATQTVTLTLDPLLEGIDIPGAGLLSRLGLSVDVPIEPNLERARPGALRILIGVAAGVAVGTAVALRPWRRDGLVLLGLGFVVAAFGTGLLVVGLPGASSRFEDSLAGVVLYSMLLAQLDQLGAATAAFLLLGGACLAGAAVRSARLADARRARER